MASAPIDVAVNVKGLAELKRLEERMEALEKDVVKLNRSLPIKAANAIKKTGRAAGNSNGQYPADGYCVQNNAGPNRCCLWSKINFLNKSLQVASQRQVNIAKLTNGLKNLGGTAADLENLVDAADKFGFGNAV